jgi:hypothetical protein
MIEMFGSCRIGVNERLSALLAPMIRQGIDVHTLFRTIPPRLCATNIMGRVSVYETYYQS